MNNDEHEAQACVKVHRLSPLKRWHPHPHREDEPLCSASLHEQCAVLCHIGALAMSSGLGAWRIRELLEKVACCLDLALDLDMGFVALSCTVHAQGKSVTNAVRIAVPGVNTHRILLINRYVNKLVAQLKASDSRSQTPTLGAVHEALQTIEAVKHNYQPALLGLAAGSACAGFTFLLGGGWIDMICAFVGAGTGNYLRAQLFKRGFPHFSAIGLAVIAAGFAFFAALLGVSAFVPGAFLHRGGYIGALLFAIPGFPLINSALDLSKFDFRSGIERFLYAALVILVSTLAGWIGATIVGLAPDPFVPRTLNPWILMVLRLGASFVGVVGFSVMFNSPLKMAITAGLIGAVANTLRLSLVDLPIYRVALGFAQAEQLSQLHGVSPQLAAFIGALCAGLLAGLLRVQTDVAAQGRAGYPRISITVPSIVIMVPGLYLYRAIYYLCSYEIDKSALWFMQAALIVVFLPVGLAVARSFTDWLRAQKLQRLKIKAPIPKQD